MTADTKQVLTEETIRALIKANTFSQPTDDGDGVYYVDVFRKLEFARAIEAAVLSASAGDAKESARQQILDVITGYETDLDSLDAGDDVLATACIIKNLVMCVNFDASKSNQQDAQEKGKE